MDTVKLQCWSVGYCSPLDEDQSFGWLEKIPAVKKFYGEGRSLFLEVSIPLSEMDLRELLSIFQRYDIDDMTQLRQFQTEENKDWFFEKKESYWHKKVFSEEKVKKLHDPNEFQKSCEDRLNNALKEIGLSIENRKIERGIFFVDEEVWIEGNVLNYSDGAEIQAKDDEYRLEKEDFDSLQQLQDEFISIFYRLLTSKES